MSGEPYEPIDKQALEAAARHSYEWEGDRKSVAYIGWDREPEPVREEWRESVRQAVYAYLRATVPNWAVFAGDREIFRAMQALSARVERIKEAVTPLVDACYDEMHGPECDDEPDDEHVASTLNEAKEVVPAGKITFGMIRRARAALAPPPKEA